MFTDNLGLIVTHTGDGGDTAQNSAMYAIPNVGKTNLYAYDIGLLEPKQDGIWVRHPTQYPDVKDFSRDQTLANVIAMGLFGYRGALSRMLWAQVKRLGLYQNNDLPTPDCLGQAIRAMGWRELYPILLFTDLFMLISVLTVCLIKARTPGKIQQWLGEHVHWIFVQGEPNNKFGIPQDVYGPFNVGTDKNLMCALYQAQKVLPTPVSYLCRKLYKHLRPYGILYPLKVYYQVDAPEIADAWQTLLVKF